MIHEPSGLLRFYSALESASHEMLQAARCGDWDSVCRLEGACTIVIAKLRQLQEVQQLDPAEQAQRMNMLRSIVANDAEIRRLCSPESQLYDNHSFSMGSVSTAVH